jgi:hypothetical protein
MEGICSLIFPSQMRVLVILLVAIIVLVSMHVIINRTYYTAVRAEPSSSKSSQKLEIGDGAEMYEKMFKGGKTI